MKKLVAYITTGFPTPSFTVDLGLALSENGVDILELGIPFSDPVADGKIIETANLKTLERGFKVDEVFEITGKLSQKIDVYWMGYFNPFFHKGVDYFIEKAVSSGGKGFIIPDLPHEEGLNYKNFIENCGLSLISFIAPTHSKERVKEIAKDSKGFIYLVAYAGITGSGTDEELLPIINEAKKVTNTPIFVGFGVNEKTAKKRAKGADGVIVGSAFMQILLDEGLTNSEKISKIIALSRVIKEEINS